MDPSATEYIVLRAEPDLGVDDLPGSYQKVKEENAKVREENEDLKVLMRKLLARL